MQTNEHYVLEFLWQFHYKIKTTFEKFQFLTLFWRLRIGIWQALLWYFWGLLIDYKTCLLLDSSFDTRACLSCAINFFWCYPTIQKFTNAEQLEKKTSFCSHLSSSKVISRIFFWLDSTSTSFHHGIAKHLMGIKTYLCGSFCQWLLCFYFIFANARWLGGVKVLPSTRKGLLKMFRSKFELQWTAL